MRHLYRWFWFLVPHRHVWRGFATKYGASMVCARCCRAQTLMDAYPWGD